MPAPRIALSHAPEFDEFEFEQCPAGRELPFLKFDHTPVQDGQWRQLNANTTAVYRYVEDYFQFVRLLDHHEHLHGVLSLVEQAGPLRTNDELEITVRSIETGFEMTSHWIFLSEGASFRDFTPQAWNEAYQRLRELEDGG